MENLIIILVVLVIIGLVTAYIIKRKRAGKKCIGCPYSDSCKKKCIK